MHTHMTNIVPICIEIPSLGTEISRHAKYGLNGRTTNGRQTRKHIAFAVDSSMAETEIAVCLYLLLLTVLCRDSVLISVEVIGWKTK